MKSYNFVAGTFPGEMYDSPALRLICEQCDQLRDGAVQNLAIWTPPGLGKSLTTERVIAQSIAENPLIHVGVISYTMTLQDERHAQCVGCLNIRGSLSVSPVLSLQPRVRLVGR